MFMSVNTLAKSLLNGKYKLGGNLTGETISALRVHRRLTGIMAWMIFGAIVIVLVISIYAMCVNLKSPATIKDFAAATGISVGAALLLLKKIWEDWSRFGLMIILVEDAKEPEVRKLLQKLVNH